MPKYKNAFHNDLNEDDTSYSEAFMAEHGEQEDEGEGEEKTARDPGNFEKRYSDLRRHQQRKDEEHAAELRKMQEQLDAATKKQLKFPKTEDEIKEWAEKYPQVAQIVETIAGMKANEALQEGEKRMESLKQMEQRITQKEAEQQLLKLHPDFSELRANDAFHDWVAEQPKYIQDALYRNNTDAHAAARAIDLYKADTGNGKKRKGAETDAKAAAAAVKTGSSASAPSAKGRAKFSESQVERMSDAEYEKNEDAILEAMKKGDFEYDMSGAAR